MCPGVVDDLKKIGSRFAFEYFLEVWKDRLIALLRNWLSKYTVDDIKRMVRRSKFPDTNDLNLISLRPHLEHLEKISTERLFEDYVAPARPDLAQTIQEMGMPGARWLVELREYLFTQIRGSGSTEKRDLVTATCDNCHKSWPVARAEFASIKECPFCGHGKDEPASGEDANKTIPEEEA